MAGVSFADTTQNNQYGDTATYNVGVKVTQHNMHNTVYDFYLKTINLNIPETKNVSNGTYHGDVN
jgi:hypothetical protein